MTAPKGGYFGKILEIDLTNKQYKTRNISDELSNIIVGGICYDIHRRPYLDDQSILHDSNAMS